MARLALLLSHAIDVCAKGRCSMLALGCQVRVAQALRLLCVRARALVTFLLSSDLASGVLLQSQNRGEDSSQVR